MRIDEGYIKFKCKWLRAKPLSAKCLKELNAWRGKLYQLGFIGAYKNGIGFGNISVRIKNTNQFIISGTQTGGIRELTEKHYTKVVRGDFKKNSLTCKGPIKASSESLTHLEVYKADKRVNAVIHVHHPKLWKKLLNKAPTTQKSVSYGTPEMADEVLRIFKEMGPGINRKKVFVMAGHRDGVIAFGKDLKQAGAALLDPSPRDRFS